VKNKLYAVGIGPGNERNMTRACRDALQDADIIIGYATYTALLTPLYPEKTFLSSGMRQERARCEEALRLAASGKRVAVVSGGDAGVYGMAGLLFELARAYADIEIAIIPGVTAANSGAALLGAPLGHDFAVISLSDLLTPWEIIARRLTAAAQADFAICLYNPMSHNRRDKLQKACDILLRHKPGGTLCGIAKNIGREGEETRLCSLVELRDTRVDMTSTVFIGSADTIEMDGNMVTPRGYRHV
jgi:precorrin-3B C17-methyltransferase